jgi:hypothetical protein
MKAKFLSVVALSAALATGAVAQAPSAPTSAEWKELMEAFRSVNANLSQSNKEINFLTGEVKGLRQDVQKLKRQALAFGTGASVMWTCPVGSCNKNQAIVNFCAGVGGYTGAFALRVEADANNVNVYSVICFDK